MDGMMNHERHEIHENGSMFGRFFCDAKQLLWKLQWILKWFCCVIKVEETAITMQLFTFNIDQNER